MIPTKRFLLDGRGTTSIEFAALSVPFFLLVLGIFGFGYISFLNNDLEHVASSVQRLVLVKRVTDEATIQSFVREKFIGNDDSLEIAVYETVTDERRYLNVDLAFVIAFPGPVEILRHGIRLEQTRLIPL